MEINPLCCVYCSGIFGTAVRYKGKVRILSRQKEHFYPRSAGGNRGKNLVWACQICNYIKADKVFESGEDARNYILDKLLESDWMIMESFN